MKEELQRVVNRISKEAIIEVLRDLVRIPSLSGEEEEIAEYLAKKMIQCGLSVEVIGGNVVGKLISARDAKTLVFNGHMDTIPVGERETWTVDPFSAEIRKDRLYGRGACDMKGGLTSMIIAMDALTSTKIDIGGNLIVTAVTFEEDSRKLTERRGIVELIDKDVIQGDAAIVGEPTNLDLSLGHRSRALFEIVTQGKAAHARRSRTRFIQLS